ANLVEEGERAAATVLDLHPRPTAVIAQADLLAIGVIRAATKAGLRVPEDLSVVGFDGIDATGWLSHPLTTVVQPMQEKGHVAGRMVADLLAGRRPGDVTLPVTFRVGATTGPPPRSPPTYPPALPSHFRQDCGLGARRGHSFGETASGERCERGATASPARRGI